MFLHIHHGESRTVLAGHPAPAGAAGATPVFVDVTGRRHRLVRRCGVLVATGSLVYLPLVAATVLSGGSVPAHGPAHPDERWLLETGDQPAAPPGERDRPVTAAGPAADHGAEGPFRAPDRAVPAPARPEPSSVPGPSDDAGLPGPVTGPPSDAPPVRPAEPTAAPPPSPSIPVTPPSGGRPTPPAPTGTPEPTTPEPTPGPTTPGVLLAEGWPTR